ncbi:trypsin-like serine protease [Rhizobium mesoamericanum]|uniref:trypsin-like serine protease n=1 Tax=Rhizobium mesoamericanum TaxID=1079800 RepID=UPI000412F8F5|nr:trypsin-like serine protease [Rhizobium mesoamericanum]
MTRWSLMIVSALAQLLVSPVSFAGSVIHDVPPADAVAFGARSEFTASGALIFVTWPNRQYFRSFCTASLITPTALLTAAHCTRNPITNRQFNPGDLVFQIDPMPDDGYHSPLYQAHVASIIPHPNWVFGDNTSGPDLAVIKLSDPIQAVTPFVVNSSDDELSGDRMISLVSYGLRGDGQGGCTPNSQGRRWGGTNVISSVGPSHEFPKIDHIIFEMKKRQERNLPLPFSGYTICAGDSGGAVLRNYNGKWTIIGVNESGYPTQATAPYFDLGLDPIGFYGETAYSTVVKPYYQWIKATAGL